MIARLIATFASLALTLAPLTAADATLIRICSANGDRFAPFVNQDGNQPRKRHDGACHAACLGDRLKLRGGKSGR